MKSSGVKINQSSQLKLYALFKQAAAGRCNTSRPAAWDLVGITKWNAWNALPNDMTRDQAMQEYISYVDLLLGSEGTSQQQQDKEDWVVFSRPSFQEDDVVLEGDRDLIYYCQEGMVEQVGALLKQRDVLLDIDSLDDNGLSPLLWACDHGHLNVVQLLLDADANVQIADEDGSTPLHYASLCGHKEIVEALLQRGADPRVLDHDDCKPADVAADDEIKLLFT